MKYYFLYKITNTVNNKIYIGVHETIDINDGYMGSGKYLSNAFTKYGVENFKKEILEYFESSEEMYNREREIVNEEFLKRKDVYNLNIGGSGSWHRCNSSGKNLYGKNGKPGFGGQNLLPAHERIKIQKERGTYEIVCQKISDTFKNKYKTGELVSSWTTNNPMHNQVQKEKQISRLKEIEHQKGSKNSQYGTMWITNLETYEHAKIKNEDNIPEGWVKGRIDINTLNKRNHEKEEKKFKLMLEKERIIEQHREWYNLYKQFGFEKFKEITDYKYTRQNLVQNFAKWLPEFTPQNGKKR